MYLTEASKGCLLLYLFDRDASNVVSWSQDNIPAECLVDEGYDRTPHVTVLYGFKPEVDAQAVVDSVTGFGKIAFKLGKISRFEQDTHDVLKVDVTGDSLFELHGYLRAEFEDQLEITYPDYKPHMTLAYVRKGACKELDGHCHFDGMIYVFDTAVYSTPNSTNRFFAILDA